MDKEPNIDYYKRINDVSEAQPDSILIYNMNGGIGYVDRKYYDLFCRYYIESNSFAKHHTMDLAFAKYHNLVLDIDFAGNYTNADISNYMTTYLKPTLKSIFDELPNFSFISSTRNNGGIHIHLPEILISSEDYVTFCEKLQHRMNVNFSNYTVNVDIPSNFTLSTASKPGISPYRPFNIWYIDQNTEFCLPLTDRECYSREHRKMKFKKKKDNSNSIFRKLIVYQYEQIIKEILYCMMPFVAYPGMQCKKITYQTIISEKTIPDYVPICNIFYEKEYFSIFKSNKLNFKSLDWLTVYNYLNNHCCKIQNLETENYALKYWFRQMKSSIVTHEDIFKDINQMIKDDNCFWRTNVHPLRSIVNYKDGLYFLPIFYTLCKVVDKSPHEILNYFTGMAIDKLINRLKLIEEKLLIDVSDKFTTDTILYCASSVRISQSENMIQENSILSKIDSIIQGLKESILQCKSKLDYEEIITNIIKRYTPIIIGIYKHSSKKPARLMWNLLIEHWQEITIDDIRHHVQLVFKRIEFFLEKNKKFQPSFDKIQINPIASLLYGIANLERKEIDMDRHKFHIKTKAGILDLLTGNTSITVPEFFMSNKSININFERFELNCFYDDKELISIYKVVTSKAFFRKFLKYLLIDCSDSFFDVIRIVALEFGIYGDKRYKYVDSILNFFCHLCKYMSFEYDVIIFMLYVISSVFIATNYYRRFFIFQGNTKNGKSKFFEMIDKVFGSYSHSIRSINLNSSKSAVGPQPELASSLHSCRFIAVEELNGKIDENFIKELTGNSQVSCRNLYESHGGGIPSAKVFASTNSPPVCTASDAFKDRVISVPFGATFSENAPHLTSEQIMNNIYKIDLSDAVVRNSYEGMFVLTYCHLTQNFDRETGLLNLPAIPELMLDFKDEYLKMTDIYAQFKQYVDLQIISNTKLLYSELVSACRKFLINTKNHLSLENTLLKRFDEEFSSYRRENSSIFDFNEPFTEENDMECENNFDEDDGIDEDEISKETSSQKKPKLTIIYYLNISIKQLKKRL